jgi:hypothetical protein
MGHAAQKKVGSPISQNEVKGENEWEMSLRAYVHHDAKSRAYATLGLRQKAARHALLASRLAFGANTIVDLCDEDSDDEDTSLSPDDSDDSEVTIISPARAAREREEREREERESERKAAREAADAAGRRRRRPLVESDDDELPPLVSDEQTPSAVVPALGQSRLAYPPAPATSRFRRPNFRAYDHLWENPKRKRDGP